MSEVSSHLIPASSHSISLGACGGGRGAARFSSFIIIKTMYTRYIEVLLSCQAWNVEVELSNSFRCML